jgi:hypothetical protein
MRTVQTWLTSPLPTATAALWLMFAVESMVAETFDPSIHVPATPARASEPTATAAL